MRRLLALFAAASTVWAPPAEAQTRVGLRAGTAVSTLSGDEITGTRPRLGLTGGAFLNLRLSPRVSVQPEVSYVQRGVSNASGTTSVHIDYVDVPVLVRYAVPVTETGLSIGGYGGPALSFKRAERIEGPFYNLATEPGRTGFFERTEVGAALGATVGAGPFAVDARYTLGLSRATDSSFPSPLPDVRNGAFSIAGTYTLGQ